MESLSPKQDVAFKGKLFEIVQTEQHDGRVFEVARRAPGVRLIIANKDEKKILLTREFRAELNAWDYRLPGGKVFDTLDEFESFRASGADMLDAAVSKAKAEGAEEAGVDIRQVELVGKSTLGATVEWDLYIFEATDWSEHADGQQLEEGEAIEADNWLSFEEARQLILDGGMQEERIALALLRWLNKQK